MCVCTCVCMFVSIPVCGHMSMWRSEVHDRNSIILDHTSNLLKEAGFPFKIRTTNLARTHSQLALETCRPSIMYVASGNANFTPCTGLAGC